MPQTRVLIVCTGNSARSQMAEGFMKKYLSDEFDITSAGLDPKPLNPLAVQVMREIGIDISRHYSKLVDKFIGENFDYVITVCDSANETCPVFRGKSERLHWSFQDPAAVQGSDDQRLAAFRNIRDEIRARIGRFLTKPLDGKT